MGAAEPFRRGHLTAAVTILVKMLYVEDVLGDTVTEEGGGGKLEERREGGAYDA